MKLKQHITDRNWTPVPVNRGKLSQKARMRELNIPSWGLMLKAAKGI